MGKRILILILIFTMFFLTLCSCTHLVKNNIEEENNSNSSLIENVRTDMLNESNDDAHADARLEEIIEALNNEDEESLISIFSTQALNEAVNIESRIDYLFDFVDGEIISWETIVHGATSESIDHGNKEKSSMSWYYVDTEKEKYLFFFVEYIVDTENPDNIGVYMLQIIKAEDKDTQFEGFGPNTRCAGIYKPEE